MDKKYIGITLFAIYYLILGLACLAGFVVIFGIMVSGNADMLLGDSSSGGYISLQILLFLALDITICSILFIFSSYLLFKRNHWGYKIPVISLLLLCAAFWSFLIVIPVHFIYFMRSGVKKQFFRAG
ncbi:MAG: hypothetical protein WBB84_05745 [Candidatus Omnitrophota bacterium]